MDDRVMLAAIAIVLFAVMAVVVVAWLSVNWPA